MSDEHTLRNRDIGRPEPSAETLDRLELNGHARNGFCEVCWGKAYMRAISQPSRDQSAHYLDILAEAERPA